MMPILCTVTDARYRATGYGVLNLCIVGGLTIYAGGMSRVRQRRRQPRVPVCRAQYFGLRNPAVLHPAAVRETISGCLRLAAGGLAVSPKMLFPTLSAILSYILTGRRSEFAFYNALDVAGGDRDPHRAVHAADRRGFFPDRAGLRRTFSTPAQVALATSLLPRLGFKRLALTGWSIRGWCLLVPVAIVVLAPVKPVQPVIYAMILAMFLYSLNRAIGAAALTTWFYQLIPAGIRGRYWATDRPDSRCAGRAGDPRHQRDIVRGAAPGMGLQRPISDRRLRGLEKHTACSTSCPMFHAQPSSAWAVSSVKPLAWFSAPGAFRQYLWMSVGIFVSITPIAPFTAFYLKAPSGCQPRTSWCLRC